MHNPVFEFHISGAARNKYKFEETLFSLEGSVVFANFSAVRLFAQKFNSDKSPDEYVPASDIYGMGLLDEINHFLIESYRASVDKKILQKLISHLRKELGEKELDKLLLSFASEFPASEVFRGKMKAVEYLRGKSGDLSNSEVLLEELIVLWLGNRNPAYLPISELIDEKIISPGELYDAAMKAVEEFFNRQPALFGDGLTLLRMLRLPAEKYPHSVTAQLEFIKENWGGYLAPLLSRLLISLDFIREEQKARFDTATFGPGPTHVIEFEPSEDDEPERFSADLHWMPRLVLIAKSTYVWLDQLSKKYERAITRLDQIPDEELRVLSARGFSGLWLIGLWERSKASQKIKQIMGNPEAVASAYSLYDYDIAADLGGEEAYRNLKERAAKYGIRLASDMVPNHMAIDSRWVIEHPHWFLQADFPPFPTYTFNGQDLSGDERVGIFIEDGYWNHSDAAVVFKRLDRQTGEAKYIYHGNDGTSMPWNDTAQLNYLLPEVREGVIQTILHVARKFPIIRFDAAMTLAKKHYQRLWFPQPGTGGDIPSRAEQAMSKKLFDQLFPVEFWREVVDRIQQEAPDTLLLAEAFWMMESYFVRTLGMHRVYNSAFMNMLKNEENDKYKQSIKNILKFNPQILKRYVNFMNNPDEETAAAQFGKDDKYFGVCILMATMPGLPMFGHGQIEGFSEKYGMEYRRAYWDEQVDEGLVQRHEREIFPLLKKRRLFSEVDHFFLFDLFTGEGRVNDNVFAYSNRAGDVRTLVVYNNKFEHAAGWIQTSAPFIKHNKLQTVQLSESLQFSTGKEAFVIFPEQISGLEYLHSCAEIAERGLFIELDAFKYQVFVNIRETEDSKDKPYAGLHAFLNGKGVPSVEEALQEFKYRPLLEPFEEAVNPGSLRWLRTGRSAQGVVVAPVMRTFEQKLNNLLEAVCEFEEFKPLPLRKISAIGTSYQNILALPEKIGAAKNKTALKEINLFLQEMLAAQDETLKGWRILLILPFLQALCALYDQKNKPACDVRFIGARSFDIVLRRNLQQLGLTAEQAARETELLKILCAFPEGLPLDLDQSAVSFFDELLTLKETRVFLGFNRFEKVLYFNKEAFEELLAWLFLLSLLHHSRKKRLPLAGLKALFGEVQGLNKKAAAGAYQWEEFVYRLRDEK